MNAMNSRIQRWFMPWTWNRWSWAILLPFVLLAYFLSAVPVLRVAHQGRLLDREIFQLISKAYLPIWIVDANCDAAAAIIGNAVPCATSVFT